MGKIIAFLNQKGGVGKTTTCVNMASYLATMGNKVLLVDLDPQGNASSSFGFDKEKKYKTVYDIMSGQANIAEVIMPTKVQGCDLIPSDVDLAGAEIEMVQMKRREHILKEMLDEVKEVYDYICIDCPPSLGLITINALTACNSVIIPIICEFLAMEGITQLMYSIKLVKKHLNEAISIEGIVLTMKSGRSTLYASVSENLKKYFKEKVYETVIPRNVRLAEAPSYGMPIVLYDNKCPGAIAYKALTEEFLRKQKR